MSFGNSSEPPTSNHMASSEVPNFWCENSGVPKIMQLWDPQNSQSDMRNLGTSAPVGPSATWRFSKVYQEPTWTILIFAFRAFSFLGGCNIFRTPEFSHLNSWTSHGPLQCHQGPQDSPANDTQDFMKFLRSSGDVYLSGTTTHHQKKNMSKL